MNFRIGCAIWAYKGWVGELFPPKSRSKDFLSLYSHRFTCVEGNTTFYSVPEAATVARWAKETPPGFEFCLKLPKTLTHNGLLKPSLPGALQFLELMQGLSDSSGVAPSANRLGPLFMQLPPSYSPANLRDLSDFLNSWSKTDAPLAVEVRHADWFKEPHRSQLNELLESLKIGRVLLDTRPIYQCDDNPQLHSDRKKPNVPLQPDVTANFTLIRYISHPDLELNQQYLQEWVEYVDRCLKQNIRVYFFVHCPVEERSPQTARHFQNLLEQHGVPVPPLPWNNVEQSPQVSSSQLSLF